MGRIKRKWKLHEFEPNLIKFQSTSISLSQLWNSWKGYKKLKVAWICGQFTQIWNHLNFFTTATKSMGMIKKVECCMNLGTIYSNFMNLGTIYSNFFTTSVKSVEMTKKVESCMNLWLIYSSSKLLQRLYHGYETSGKY